MEYHNLEEGLRKIRKLMGDLDAAFYERIRKPGIPTLAFLIHREDHFLPESEMEKLAWEELISPDNFEALQRYSELFCPTEVSERTQFAHKLFACLLSDAQKRRSNKH